MVAVIDAYREHNPDKKVGKAKSLIRQVKTLKDVDKTYVDPET